MPRPTFADRRNSLTLLSAFAEPVILADGSEISAVVRERRRLTYDGIEAAERLHQTLSLPFLLSGTLAQSQSVVVRGVTYYVASLTDLPDGWLLATLSTKPTT